MAVEEGTSVMDYAALSEEKLDIFALRDGA
jgi:hypothetical protein